MRKSMLTIVIVFLTMLQAIYGQQPEAPRMAGFSYKPDGEGTALLIAAESRQGLDSVTVRGKLEFSINKKPVKFQSGAKGSVVMNDGTLSDAEIQLIVAGINAMKSAVSRSKFEETPEVSFKIKADGTSLLVDVEPQRKNGVVFQGKFVGFFDERDMGKPNKPIEFRSDPNGNIIMNNGTLSANEINAVKIGIEMMNNFFKSK
jgi:hypothetical protein